MMHSTGFINLARRSDSEAAALVYGEPEKRPKFLHDLEAIELIHGPPEEILSEEDFRVYQKWMADTCLKQDVFLGAEMGLGKTAAVLYALRQMFDEGFCSKVLIVGPVKVVEQTWPEEIAKWSFARGFTYRVVTGDEDQRRAALECDAQITLINRENLVWLQRTIGTRRWDFEVLVYDEASRLKSGRKRTKGNVRKGGSVSFKRLTELGILRQMRFKFKRIIELSGTPSPNGLIDLWGPIYLIDCGKRLGTSRTAYKKRWFYPDTRYSYSKNEPFPHAEAEIMSRLNDVFYSLREEDYLDLPPLMEIDREVSMTPFEMKKYKDFENEMAIKVVNNQGDPEIIEALNNGVLTGKLLQFANGSLYLNDNSAKKIHEHKLDELDSIVEESMGRPILVAYSFKFDIAAIKRRFPYARLYGDTPNDMRDWNAGRIRMLVTHPASAGHGLNFQKGSNIAVWYGLTWSLELYRQFRKRLHRSGQRADKVFLYRIITRGTVDTTVLKALGYRGATQDSITDAVRVRLQKVAA